MAETRKDGSLVLLGDADYQPVQKDKPAPGGSTDHTSPGIGQMLGDFIRKATNADKVNNALTKK
jgi:hypothetical protein